MAVAIHLSGVPATNWSEGGATLTPYVYVVDSGNNRVQAFDYDGMFVFSFGSAGSGNGQFNNPYGITDDGDRLYVTDRGNNRIQIFDMWGNYISQFGTPGTGLGQFNSPMGIAVDDRWIWIVDSGNNRFQVTDKETLTTFFELGSFGSGTDQFNAPTDCSVDSFFFYITDLGNGRVVEYPKNLSSGVEIYASFKPMTSDIYVTSSSSSIDASLKPMTAELEIKHSVIVTINADLPNMESEITTVSSSSVSINASFKPMTIEITVVPKIESIIDASFKPITSEFTILQAGLVIIDAALPAMRAELSVIDAPTAEQFTTIVMNTLNKAVTEYTGYNFNSYAIFQGRQIGADATGTAPGIYELTGDTDGDDDIDAHIKTRDFDIHAATDQERVTDRRIDDIHLNLIARDDIVLKLQKSRDAVRTFDIRGSENDNIHEKRVKPSKGMKDRIYSIEIRNKNGSYFELDEIVVETSRTMREVRKRG